MITFIDDSSKYSWVYIIKNKNDAFETFRKWRDMIEAQYEKKIKILRTDNGGEYVNRSFKIFLDSNNIIHQNTKLD